MSTAQQSTSAEVAIENAINTLIEAYRLRDAELATSFYVKDERYALFDIMPPVIDAGFDRLLEKTKAFFAATEGPVEIEITNRHIGTGADMAYLRALMTAKAKFADGRTLSTTTRYTLVFQLIDGDWLVVHEHNSLPAEGLSF